MYAMVLSGWSDDPRTPWASDGLGFPAFPFGHRPRTGFVDVLRALE